MYIKDKANSYKLFLVIVVFASLFVGLLYSMKDYISFYLDDFTEVETSSNKSVSIGGVVGAIYTCRPNARPMVCTREGRTLEELVEIEKLIKQSTNLDESLNSYSELQIFKLIGKHNLWVWVITNQSMNCLFRSGQGLIAQGKFIAPKIFLPTKLMIKHDEVYKIPSSR